MIDHSKLRTFACLGALLGLLLVTPLPAASPPAPAGTGGAVATDDRHGTAAGLEALAAGGNAVDAAVAAALAMAVTYPEAGNLGGGGFAVVRLGGEVASLDFREVGPAAARHDMYLGEDGELRDEASLVGPLAAGVPGSPAGLYELHRRFGSLPWARVVAPAERLAREGFPVDRNLYAKLLDKQELLARFPETAAVWLPGGAPPAPGEVVRFPALAATLRAYGEVGPSAIVSGSVAAEIEAVSARHGGILTTADLAAYRPVWREPVRFDAFGWQVASMDLPSSGGIILGEVAGLLERLGWQAAPRFGAERAHLLAESFRAAFADRFQMGDPDETAVTAAQLLDPAWLDRRAAAIDRARAADSRRLAPYPGEAPADLPPAPASGADGADGADESGDTTHISVVDGEGNAVALTTTLNGLFGSKAWVPGFGFLNNEMDDFAALPGRPNDYGLVQGEANAVRPGRRMLSSMTPTLAWRSAVDGDGGGSGGGAAEVVAVGGRGGSRIPTNTAQVLFHLLADGDALQAALDRPRLHHQWLPNRLLAEPDALSPETRAVLEARGHEIEEMAEWAAAKVNLARALADGTAEAAAEPRGSGAAGVVVPDVTQPAVRIQ